MWRDAQTIVDLCDPIVKVLRLADSDKPTTGLVWQAMSDLLEHAKTASLGSEKLTEKRREKIITLVNKRWEFLHADIYAAAYALNPVNMDIDVQTDNEVMQGLRNMLRKLLTEEEYHVALSQFADFKNKVGTFGSDEARKSAVCMEPYKWWQMYGSSTPALMQAAIKILSQTPTSSPCERNWSAYEWIHSKKRNKLVPARAEKLVYVFQNMRAVRKFENKDLNDKYLKDVQDMLAEEDLQSSDSETE